ncbi:hypothetical protein U4959_06600 [Acinetobacter junii]|nr:hypothetical protein [Acinetobacter junii]WRL36412.1 hypothetical protein U4959_06600 [Acinetobacter junii]
MDKLSESRTLRVWTYIIGCLVIIGIFFLQAAPILASVAKIIEVIG